MENQQEKKVKEVCEKLNDLLDKTYLEGYSHLQQIENRRLKREKRDFTNGLHKLNTIYQL